MYDQLNGSSMTWHPHVPILQGGDASTRLLASMQDETMATLKDSMVTHFNPDVASRGRDNYSRLAVLRTKPGRADSPPTLSMSCSDKVASWNVLGFQGALAAYFFGPLYLSTVVIGEVPPDMRRTVRDDCERAFWTRLERIRGTLMSLSMAIMTDLRLLDLPAGYTLHRPVIQFTSHPFMHSRTTLGVVPSAGGSCNDCVFISLRLILEPHYVSALCWIADSTKPHEVLINGLKRGVSPKHRFREKSR